GDGVPAGDIEGNEDFTTTPDPDFQVPVSAPDAADANAMPGNPADTGTLEANVRAITPEEANRARQDTALYNPNAPTATAFGGVEPGAPVNAGPENENVPGGQQQVGFQIPGVPVRQIIQPGKEELASYDRRAAAAQQAAEAQRTGAALENEARDRHG